MRAARVTTLIARLQCGVRRDEDTQDSVVVAAGVRIEQSYSGSLLSAAAAVLTDSSVSSTFCSVDTALNFTT